MKGILISTVLLFSLAIGTLICTAVSLQSDVCDVRLAEITHQGDIGAAAGLTVVSKNHWKNHAVWTTAHALGHPETAETDFDFSAWRIYAKSDYDPTYLTIDSDPSRGFDFTDAVEKFGMPLGEIEAQNFDVTNEYGSFREAATDPSLGLAAAYNELYMDTLIDTEGKKRVRLSDYYDYYPINVHIHLPGVIWTNNDVSPTTVAEPGTEAYVVQAFRDYFKIPMLDEVLEIHMTRTSDHGFSWGSSTVEGVGFYFYALSAADSKNCYFTFNTETDKGEQDMTIDTSEIKGGYGIYRLPYRRGTSTSDIGVDVDAMEMVYPLKPGTQIEGLYFNAAETRLLLVTKADAATVQIDVIDPVSYDCLQTFSVGGAFFHHLKIYEDYTVAVTHDKLMVLTEADGTYTHAFTTACTTDTEGEPIAVTSDHVTAFDGTRLAVADNTRAEKYSGIDMCGYDVTVYSADGILWDGTVTNTLDTGLRKNTYSQDDIAPLYGEQLALSWE